MYAFFDPLVGFTGTLMTQSYKGMITIVPQVKLRDYFLLFSNPSLHYLKRCFQGGSVAAYQKIGMMKSHYSIAHVLDECLATLETIDGPLDKRRRRDYAVAVSTTEEMVAVDAVVVADKETTSTSPADIQAEEGATTTATDTTTTPASTKSKSKMVYVGNLSWDVTWKELKDHMGSTGCAVLHADVLRSQGRSKGCGLVQFETAYDMSKAILTLNDTKLMGRPIFVREACEDTNGGNSEKKHHGNNKGGLPNHSNNNNKGVAAGSDVKSHRVYVGNLSWDVTWQDLKGHMRDAGGVSYAEVRIEGHDRSKGYGIVTYQKAQEATRAIRELQNTMLNGRPIFVREYREQGGNSHGFKNGGGRGGGGNAAGRSCQLFVSNLSSETTWKDLKEHFGQCGKVERSKVMSYPNKGFGTVCYFNSKDAQDAIENLNGVDFMGRELIVKLDPKAN